MTVFCRWRLSPEGKIIALSNAICSFLFSLLFLYLFDIKKYVKLNVVNFRNEDLV